MTKRIVILDFGDTHAGSEYGLLHPETILEREREDGTIERYSPELSEIQKFLFYEIYKPFVQEIMEFAGDDDVIAIHKGDVTQGNKYTEELLSPRLSDQILIATKNMSEVLKYSNVKIFRMIKGTSSHSFQEGSSDVLVANNLRLMYPEKDVAVHYHGLYTIQDVNTVVDVSHHGPSAGIRKWLEGNNFRYYLRDIMMRELLKGNNPPDIVSRAHAHTALEEYLSINGHRMWGFISPTMQFPTGYARQVTNSVSGIRMGMLAIEVILHDNGQKTIYPFWYTRELDIRSKEIL